MTVTELCACLAISTTAGERGAGVQLVDVRSPGEYAAGHVPTALNLPLEQLRTRMGDLERQRTVVLICQGGQRAALAARQLAGSGYEVAILEGGTHAWREGNLPLVCQTATRWSLERQVRFSAGLLILIGVTLTVFVHPGWLVIPAFIGAGLTFSGVSGRCGLAYLLGNLPWNRPRACNGIPRQQPG